MTTITRKPAGIELRAFEFRNEGPPDGRTLEGYASVFRQPTRIEALNGEFDEQILPGAFKRTLQARKPVLQFDHGRDARTGSVPIGSINDIREDEHGLYVSARLFDNDAVAPIRDAIAGGAINGMSFRFRVPNGGDIWTDAADRDDGGDVDLRSVREVQAFELGPVVFPAYEGTSVGVRSLLMHLPPDEREQLVAELAEAVRASDEQRTAFGSHDTAVEDGDWSEGENLGRIDWPITMATARRLAAGARSDQISNGEVTRTSIVLPHHFVDANGNPGAASRNGVNAAKARLNQVQGFSDAEKDTMRRHLDSHVSSDDDDNENSSEPAASTSDKQEASPTARHLALYGESAGWHLPDPHIGTGGV